MKIKNVKEVNDFLEAVRKCKGEVWLESQEGDKFNLKSTLSQYVALGALLSERGDRLELFCEMRQDEANFFEFFHENPSVLKVG